MTALRAVPDTTHVVAMRAHDDFDEWRDHARRMLMARVPPDRTVWTEPGGSAGDLFGLSDHDIPEPHAKSPVPRVPRRFIEIARLALLNSNPSRFGLLYRMLWRLQDNPRLIEDAADSDVRAMAAMAREVRRDIHKMRAFVRFREARGEDGQEQFVAWFEPFHHIVRHNAGFFTRRFANMQWSILTPQLSLHWDGERLFEGPPAHRGDAPADDPVEDLWRGYYASIFNPARLKIGAMLKEMPRKYWKNMPETQLIADLVATAQSREAAMVTNGALDLGERPETLDAIGQAITGCSLCPIGKLHNTAVMGEGPQDATLMIVGEQPGDHEDLEGRPFVGPAGQLLDHHLALAGIDRDAAYVTNSVKHFKYEQRGKRRIHQSPTAREIDTCRWWLEAERKIVSPRLVLAMGASAARGVLGKTVSIGKARGQSLTLDDGSELWITSHPSYLLRLDGRGREEQERLFQADLAAVAKRLSALVVL